MALAILDPADAVAESTPIVAAFPKVNVTLVTGKIAFDPHRDLIKPPYALFEVQQGHWKSQRNRGRRCIGSL